MSPCDIMESLNPNIIHSKGDNLMETIIQEIGEIISKNIEENLKELILEEMRVRLS